MSEVQSIMASVSRLFPYGATHRGEDPDEFSSFLLQGSDARGCYQAAALSKVDPEVRLIRLLKDDGYLVAEIGARFRSLRSPVVGRCGTRTAHELIRNSSSSRSSRQRLGH